MHFLLAQWTERRVAIPEAIGSTPIGEIRRVDPWTLLALEVRRIPPFNLEWKTCAAEFDNCRGKSGHLNLGELNEPGETCRNRRRGNSTNFRFDGM